MLMHNTLTAPCEKAKTFSFTFSRVKNIFAFLPCSRFLENCCIPFRSVCVDQELGVYLNLLKSIYNFL